MCILPCESGNRMPGFPENAGGEVGMKILIKKINAVYKIGRIEYRDVGINASIEMDADNWLQEAKRE